MAESVPIAEMTVEDTLTLWPETSEVFRQYNMACVGCPVSPFYTVAEAAVVYQLAPSDFVRELEQAVVGESAKD